MPAILNQTLKVITHLHVDLKFVVCFPNRIGKLIKFFVSDGVDEDAAPKQSAVEIY